MSVPQPVVEAELNFLLDVSGKIIGRDPRSMNVKGGFTSVIEILVNHPQLIAVPGVAVGGPTSPRCPVAVIVFNFPPNEKSISLM